MDRDDERSSGLAESSCGLTLSEADYYDSIAGAALRNGASAFDALVIRQIHVMQGQCGMLPFYLPRSTEIAEALVPLLQSRPSADRVGQVVQRSIRKGWLTVYYINARDNESEPEKPLVAIPADILRRARGSSPEAWLRSVARLSLGCG